MGASKKLSRTAALRIAKAAMSGEVPALGLEPLPELDPKIAIAIDSYRPGKFTRVDWFACLTFARELLTAYQPATHQKLSSVGGMITRYLRFAYHHPGRRSDEPLGWTEVLSLDLIDTYVASLASSRTETTRATIRAVLRRAVKGRLGTRAPEALHYAPIQPPYTSAECAGLVRLARNQPTDYLRRSLSAVVALGLGAGLNGREIGSVRRSEIVAVRSETEAACYRVTVKGKRAREVVLSQQYEELLHEALRIHDQQGRGDIPLIGEEARGQDAANDAKQRAKTAVGSKVNLTPRRLRSSWLVACMEASVPLSVLMRAAGLQSARSLADLLPYCSEPDPTVTASMLHSIGSK